MISNDAIVEWQSTVGFASSQHAEQDLVLSRLIIEIASNALLSEELRALYQRRKGRDLFDLWLALTELNVPPEAILAGFAPYRPDGYTKELAIAGLTGHLAHPSFRADAEFMAVASPNYDLDQAGDLIRTALLNHL